MRISLAVVVLGLGVSLAAGQSSRILKEWRFDTVGDLKGWEQANHISGLRVGPDGLSGVLEDWDPFVRSPEFEFEATPWQRVEVRLRTTCHGQADIFWTGTTESPYGGFFPEKHTSFDVVGDGQWHDYEITPFWQGETRIVLLRLDLPRATGARRGRARFDVARVRIVDDGEPVVTTTPEWQFPAAAPVWDSSKAGPSAVSGQGLVLSAFPGGDAFLRAPALRLDADATYWCTIEMSVDRGTRASLRWAGDRASSLNVHSFPVIADGRMHTYNLDLASRSGWRGNILALRFSPSDEPGAQVAIRRIALSDTPQGPPVLVTDFAGIEEAIARPGRPLTFVLSVTNRGGEPARNVRLQNCRWPAGIALDDPSVVLPDIMPFDTVTVETVARAVRPVTGAVEVAVSADGAAPAVSRWPVRVDPARAATPMPYVPEPTPAKTDYEIGAFYYPGWATRDRWERIWPLGRKHRPVLGWYDESNPECADWQIKWAVEHGISFFLVDWYWHRGSVHHTHWLHEAYGKARYRQLLKFALMWANHNAPGSHSEEDQRAVTAYWIEHYFSMPEYYRIEDRPVIMIWSPQNMERDAAEAGGVKRLLEISQAVAREAGYKGIWFITMKWPEASTEAADIQWLADAGFDMTSLYHYMHHGGEAANPRRFNFDLVAQSSYEWWQSRRKTGVLPFLPNLATGWDARPWHGEKTVVIRGRTVDLFRDICRDARRFADETGVRRLVLAPLNEWGEGSYAEPCREFGFGMYEAVRDTFCEPPPEGWPPALTPADVGLGPYDLPAVNSKGRLVWEFEDGPEGWNPMMGIEQLAVEEGALQFVSTSHDPALALSTGGLRAAAVSAMDIRMRVRPIAEKESSVQLFWSTLTAPVSEATSVSVPLAATDEYRVYRLPVAENPRWRGSVRQLRLDPCSTRDTQITIDRIRFVPAVE